MPMEKGRSPVAWDVKEDNLFCALLEPGVSALEEE